MISLNTTPLSKFAAASFHFFSPKDTLDYAVISHFHNDHYGKVEKETPYSKKGDYRLTGITAVGDSIPFKYLIDRAYPDYNYPKDLRKKNGNKKY